MATHKESRHIRLTEDQLTLVQEVADRYTDGNLSQAMRMLMMYGYEYWYITIRDKVPPENMPEA